MESRQTCIHVWNYFVRCLNFKIQEKNKTVPSWDLPNFLNLFHLLIHKCLLFFPKSVVVPDLGLLFYQLLLSVLKTKTNQAKKLPVKSFRQKQKGFSIRFFLWRKQRKWRKPKPKSKRKTQFCVFFFFKKTVGFSFFQVGSSITWLERKEMQRKTGIQRATSKT